MKYVGNYNSTQYTVSTIDEDGNETEVYRAGNHPNDSQIYVSSKDGVGLRKMRKFCMQTTKYEAKENNGEYAGVYRDKEDKIDE